MVREVMDKETNFKCWPTPPLVNVETRLVFNCAKWDSHFESSYVKVNLNSFYNYFKDINSKTHSDTGLPDNCYT